LYFVSSPAAVTIWNHPQIKRISAISARSPNAQLMTFWIVVIKAVDGATVDPGSVGLAH
jgi:hypothetical protein